MIRGVARVTRRVYSARAFAPKHHFQDGNF